MDGHQYHRARSRLPCEARKFPYFKDYYALQLLRYAFADGTPLQHVKASTFRHLLKRPAVAGVLARCGDCTLSHAHLLGAWPVDYEVFWLTMGEWSADYYHRGYSQISRPGRNHVLQLNFSSRHDRPYRRYIRPVENDHPFVYSHHPISRDRLTLAWARIDVEFDTGEALIEEVQSDWTRCARVAGRYFREPRSPRNERRWMHGRIDGRVSRRDVLDYMDRVFWRYDKIWAEAMLCASLWFLRARLGIRTIYYHSPESSRVFKQTALGVPPRSIYSRLPRRFCFTQTTTPPKLLSECPVRFVQHLARQHDVPWHVLRL
jgi:hypothetical protein